MAYRIYMPLPNPLPCKLQSAIKELQLELDSGIDNDGWYKTMILIG